MLCALALVVTAGSETVRAENERGRKLFHNCVQCHGEVGEGSRLALAPAIGGLEEWYVQSQLTNFKGGIRGGHPGDLAGLRMMPLAKVLKSEEDIQAVSAYVATLPKANPEPELEGGDPAKGQAFYTTCAACHGAKGEGVQAVNGPSLTSNSDWYLYDTLIKYKAGSRGFHQKDINGALMRSMANTLPDEQAVRDVVAYIMTLR